MHIMYIVYVLSRGVFMLISSPVIGIPNTKNDSSELESGRLPYHDESVSTEEIQGIWSGAMDRTASLRKEDATGKDAIPK